MNNSKAKQALIYFTGGYNCAQAVFAAFVPDIRMEEDLALRVSAAFGGGVHGQRDICGAMSGLAMAVSMLYGGDGKFEGRENAKQHFVQLLMPFTARFGSYRCSDLIEANLPAELLHPEATVYPERNARCLSYVAYAAQLLEDYANKHPYTL